MIKTVKLFMKHDDRSGIRCFDEGGKEIIDQDGYMPYVGILGGDDTSLAIDNATGTIIGWVPLRTIEFESQEE